VAVGVLAVARIGTEVVSSGKMGFNENIHRVILKNYGEISAHCQHGPMKSGLRGVLLKW
jgi:hypothetical protein